MLTNEELDAIEARANAATDGPMTVELLYKSPAEEWEILGPLLRAADGARWSVFASCSRAEDAAFISAARSDVPRLVAEIRRLLEDLSVNRSDVSELQNDVDDIMLRDKPETTLYRFHEWKNRAETAEAEVTLLKALLLEGLSFVQDSMDIMSDVGELDEGDEENGNDYIERVREALESAD